MFAAKDLFFDSNTGLYQISRSVRFRSSASGYFSRTPAAAGNRRTFTWSGWIKRGLLNTQMRIISCSNNNALQTLLTYNVTSDAMGFQFANSTVFTTTQVFRDPSAWYHVVLAVDTTQATSTNRAKLYINGSQVTALTVGAYPALNAVSDFNNNLLQTISSFNGTSEYFNGYMAEINFIDGQALTPSSFGATDPTTGVWEPIRYAGTYGTNGYYLNFSDNSASTATTIGKDSSGNGNNWTPSNISVTAGATYDSMVDTPTSYGTDRGNYCVWNPNFRFSYSGGFAGTFSNGNLQVATGGNPTQFAGSMALPDGAYFEVTPSSIDVNRTYVGLFAVSRSNLVTSTTANAYAGTYNVLYSNDGTIYVNTTSGSTIFGSFSTYTNGDVISVAYKSGKIYFAKNNVWQNSGVPASGTGYVATGWDAYGDLLPYCGFNSTFTGNFGQQPFTYTPPTSFIGVCSTNLSTPTIANGASYMAATTYAGNSSSQSITNTVNSASFKPDFVWVKNRSSVTNHYLWDSVRGVLKELYSNLTNAESTNTIGLSAFNSNGFTLNNGDSAWNASGSNYIGWQWLAGAGTTSNIAVGSVSSGVPSIASTVSVNATAGFSVVTYTGNGVNATVGHGINAAPSMVIIFERSPGGDDHIVYHSSLTSNQYAIRLNTTAAQTGPFGTYWNSTSPTSSVFSVGTSGENNQNTATYVAYCFAPIAGYSAFGSYTGNGAADGPFIYTGFRPRFVITKSYDATAGIGDWTIHDTSRLPYNTNDLRIFANSSSAESTSEAMDMLSNGFKIRATNSNCNTSGGGYIYAAFAENPFKYALAR